MASISLMLVLTVGFIGMSKTVFVLTPMDHQEISKDQREEYQRAMRLDELERMDYAQLDERDRLASHHVLTRFDIY